MIGMYKIYIKTPTFPKTFLFNKIFKVCIYVTSFIERLCEFEE